MNLAAVREAFDDAELTTLRVALLTAYHSARDEERYCAEAQRAPGIEQHRWDFLEQSRTDAARRAMAYGQLGEQIERAGYRAEGPCAPLDTPRGGDTP